VQGWLETALVTAPIQELVWHTDFVTRRCVITFTLHWLFVPELAAHCSGFTGEKLLGVSK